MGRLCRVGCVIGYAFGVLAAAPVNASSYDVEPFRVTKVYNAGGSYAYTEVVYSAYDPVTGQRKYLARPTPLSVASLGKLARRAVRLTTPAGIALTLALEARNMTVTRDAAGEGWDAELSPYNINYTGSYWRFNSDNWGSCAVATGGVRDFWTNPQALAAWAAANYTTCSPSAACPPITPVSGRAITTNGALNGSWSIQLAMGRAHSNYPSCNNGNGGNITYGAPITRVMSLPSGATLRDGEVPRPWGYGDHYLSQVVTGVEGTNSSLEENLYSPSLGEDLSFAAALLNEALRHGYADLWTELAAEIASLRNKLDDEHPDYDPLVWNAAQHNEHVALEGSGSSSAGSVSVEFPAFCSWAGIVCSFIEWFQAEASPPEDPDLPVTFVDSYDVVTVGGGSYSCPSPTSLGSALGQPLVFSWELPCDFAEASRPIILLCCLATAAFVLVGWRAGT